MMNKPFFQEFFKFKTTTIFKDIVFNISLCLLSELMYLDELNLFNIFAKNFDKRKKFKKFKYTLKNIESP